MLLKSYDDIVLAQSNIIRDGSVKGETLFLFKRALARARLGFPKKLQNYIEKLSKEADEVFQIDLLDPPEKATKARIKYDLIVKFIHEEPYKAFAPYMRLGL